MHLVRHAVWRLIGKFRMLSGFVPIQLKNFSHVPFSTYIGKSHAQKEKINRRVHEIPMEAFLQLEEGSINNAKAKNKNLTKCAYKNMPKSVGGKPGEAERKRKRNPQSERSTSKYTERVPTPPKPTLNTNTFKVKWLKNSRVYRCYGCR